MISFAALPVLALLLAASVDATTVSEAVAEGNRHFRAECKRQQALMPELLTAIQYNDLSRSITAYTAARPPYEQIETLANAFTDLDAAIDARPYSYRFGEDDPNFRGFHVIERALYRDQRVDSELYQVAVTLNESVNALCVALTEMERYDPFVVFEGSVALAFEVPYKKVASEEETWSDLSLMIFRNNYQGVWSQISPFFKTGKVSEETMAKAKMEYMKMQMILNEIDPDNAFDTLEGTARPYSNVSFPERARIIHTGYDFALVMEKVAEESLAGLTEPDGADEDEDGEGEKPLDNSKFVEEVKKGVAHFVSECRKQQRLLVPLKRALESNDLPAAKRAYEIARPPYEQIETLAVDFMELDGFIDARPYAYARGELDEGWRGMHEIERDLFRDDDVSGALAATIVVSGDVDALCEVLEKGARGDESTTFSAENSFEGMINLAFEVPAKKISSEEETWSDLSVMIFRENLKGIWSQFAPFKDRLPVEVYGRVEHAYMMMRSYFTYVVDIGNDFETGVTFARYSKTPVWQRKGISDGFYELGRALREARDALAEA